MEFLLAHERLGDLASVVHRKVSLQAPEGRRVFVRRDVSLSSGSTLGGSYRVPVSVGVGTLCESLVSMLVNRSLNRWASSLLHVVDVGCVWDDPV